MNQQDKIKEAIERFEIKPLNLSPTLADFDNFEKNYRKAVDKFNKTITPIKPCKKKKRKR